jgi:hypothetical protein
METIEIQILVGERRRSYMRSSDDVEPDSSVIALLQVESLYLQDGHE